MIAIFKLNYGSDGIYEKLSEEQKLEFTKEYGEYSKYGGIYAGNPALAIKIFKEVVITKIVSELYHNRLHDIIVKLENSIASIDNERTMNNKCNVHVGGHALMLINKTLLLEDACTDSLQCYLDKGWRIIAACVQPDGRRPDYILGRYEEKP